MDNPGGGLPMPHGSASINPSSNSASHINDDGSERLPRKYTTEKEKSALVLNCVTNNTLLFNTYCRPPLTLKSQITR